MFVCPALQGTEALYSSSVNSFHWFRFQRLSAGCGEADITERWVWAWRRDAKGFRYQRLVWRMPLKKPSCGSGNSCGSPVLASPGDWGRKYPLVCEFLSTSVWEDGSSREPGSLTLFVQDGRWKACLNCKDTNRVAFVSSETPTDLLSMIEKGLDGDRLDWRAQKGTQGARKGKG